MRGVADDAPRAGWLPGLVHVPSPNFNARPHGVAVDLLVIHAISLPAGHYGGPWIRDLFLNRLNHAAHPSFEGLKGLRVSAHFLVSRGGESVQFVSIDERAWHAGVSRHGGREGCNDFSIGIELEGCDEDGFTDAQYAALSALTRRLMRACPRIVPDRIVGHADIAPGRKTDPGPYFDWLRYRAELQRPA
mgnify:FL=1